MEEAPGEDCSSSEEKADGLVAVEAEPLFVAGGFALLLDVIRLELKVDHGGVILWRATLVESLRVHDGVNRASLSEEPNSA